MKQVASVLTAMAVILGATMPTEAAAQWRTMQRKYSNYAAPHDDEATVTLVFENDSIFSTDQNYTNGVRGSWLSGTMETEGISQFLADAIGADKKAVHRKGIAFGHAIFTPEDIVASAYLPNQHPYAGFLYLEGTRLIEQPNRVDQFTAQIGIVGPSAAGEWVQNNFHALLGIDGANGWDNQIDDEVTLTFSYDRKLRRVGAIFNENGLSFDFTPSFGASVGTALTSANAGLMMRFGQDLRNDYGPPRIRPSLAGTGYFTPQDNFSWYLFAGAEGRAVAHNIFLDGSIFRDEDTHIESRTYVGDFQFGAVMQYRKTQVALTLVRRSEEFKEQVEPQRFGALSLSRKF